MNPEALTEWFDFALKLVAIVAPLAITYFVSKNQNNAARIQKVNEYLKIARAAVQASEDANIRLTGRNKLLKAISIFDKATAGKVSGEIASTFVRSAFREIEDNGGFKKSKK